jgi:aspartokinase-like uncharacterized kinase
VGGSLLEGDVSRLMQALSQAASRWRLAVIPGGGIFADAVREACARHAPGEDAAHWMAILAMDQHAHLLTDLAPNARLVATFPDIEAAASSGELPVLAPYACLRTENPLPHGWHVTSDSIAAWVARRTKARRLVLLKSIEGVTEDGSILNEVGLGSPTLTGVVDDYFREALDPQLECWILSGRHPERLSQLLDEGRAAGTRLRAR